MAAEISTEATPSTTLLTGWGRTAPTAARIHRPAGIEQVAELILARRNLRPVLARGLGRGYGDAAQCAGGDVVSTAGLDGLELDERSGRATVGAGLDFDRLLRAVVPRGWFVPVTPGTRFVSAGGALAADVHGKNHHVSGTLTAHVPRFDLIDGLGQLRRLSPTEEPDAFWATVGGLGLTGVITEVVLQLQPITSSWMAVHTERACDLDTLMTALRAQDRVEPYTVAWLDTLSRGKHFGRGVITSGHHADAGQVSANGVSDPLSYQPARVLTVPRLPVGVISSAAMRAFNETWFRRAPARPRDDLQPLEAFFHPLDRLAAWNRLYGRGGFLQYQFVVPDGREDVVHMVIESLQREHVPSSLAVLKRFGVNGPGLLSFPRPGWTLTLDIPARRPGLAPVLDRLDAVVADAGGRVYLVKDSRVRPELLDAMYPELGHWRAVRERLDPERRFGSDLSRRTGL